VIVTVFNLYLVALYLVVVKGTRSLPAQQHPLPGYDVEKISIGREWGIASQSVSHRSSRDN
jgi:hypothetical protein